MRSLLKNSLLGLWVVCLWGVGTAMAQKNEPVDLTPGYNVGVYYFPGWRDNTPGAPSKKPWDAIKKFPKKEPLQGWYDEGSEEVTTTQINQIRKGGIDFVAFDWYWAEGGKPYLDHAVSAFLKNPAWRESGLQFTFMWANHMNVPNTVENFDQMFNFLCKYYFGRPDYMKMDGRPIIYIFSQENLRNQARKLGLQPKDLLASARRIAKQQGFPDLYIVGSAEAVPYWVTDFGRQTGYDAYSTYNYHRGFEGKYIPERRTSHSFEELSDAYQMSWDWILKNSPVPYIVPGTAGWNRTPWGGSKDPKHDDSEATPKEFEAHLLRLKKVLDANPGKTLRTTVLCCWNEHGEGSVIEPTKEYGETRLKSIVKVFGQSK